MFKDIRWSLKYQIVSGIFFSLGILLGGTLNGWAQEVSSGSSSVEQRREYLRQLQEEQRQLEALQRGETTSSSHSSTRAASESTSSGTTRQAISNSLPDSAVMTSDGVIYITDGPSAPVPIENTGNQIVITPTKPVDTEEGVGEIETGLSEEGMEPADILSSSRLKEVADPSRQFLMIISAICFGGAVFLFVAGVFFWLKPKKTSRTKKAVRPPVVPDPLKTPRRAPSLNSLEPVPIPAAIPMNPEPTIPAIPMANEDRTFDTPLITEDDINAQVYATISQTDWLIRENRFPQAEKLVTEHLDRLPSNHRLLMKLLEIYMCSGNSKAFNKVAKDFHQSLDNETKEWQRVTQWGQMMDPTNPLYTGAEEIHTIRTQSSTIEPMSAPAPLFEPEPLEPLTASLERRPATPTRQSMISSHDPFAGYPYDHGEDREMTFDRGLNTIRKAPEKITLDPLPINHSYEEEKRVSEIASIPSMSSFSQAPSPSKVASEPSSLDRVSLNGSVQKPTVNKVELDLDVSSPQMPSKDISLLFDPHSDERMKINMREVSSRLELVRAYEDMGDFVGAKELLHEIIQSAHNPQQRALAQEMLRDIS